MREHFDRAISAIPELSAASGSCDYIDPVAETIHNQIDFKLSHRFEMLRTAQTGREAVLEMLHQILVFSPRESVKPEVPFAAILLGRDETDSSQQWRCVLRNLIVERLERSVYEGELAEDADVAGLSCLCIAFASGLAMSLRDGVSAESLAASVSLFVERVGFNRVRAKKRRPRKHQSDTQGLRLVKR